MDQEREAVREAAREWEGVQGGERLGRRVGERREAAGSDKGVLLVFSRSASDLDRCTLEHLHTHLCVRRWTNAHKRMHTNAHAQKPSRTAQGRAQGRCIYLHIVKLFSR